MPLNDKYPRAVTFVIRPVQRNSRPRRLEPVGTGFVVRVPTRDGSLFDYVVTASHVVDGATESYVRIATVDGKYRDEPVDEWVHHDNADVAAAKLHRRDDMDVLWVPAAGLSWPGSRRLSPDLGDRVYFLGLLALPAARDMAERNVSMVRSGTVGALYQNDIPHKWPDGTTRRFEAHLVDCRSFGGFSGSPCFFQRDDQLTGVSIVEV